MARKAHLARLTHRQLHAYYVWLWESYHREDTLYTGDDLLQEVACVLAELELRREEPL